MACNRDTYGSLFYLVTDNFKEIPVEDSQQFKNATFNSLKILFDLKEPFSAWDLNQLIEFVNDFCKTVSNFWEQSNRNRPTLKKNYNPYFDCYIIFMEEPKYADFKVPNERPKKRHRAGSARTKLFSSELEKPRKFPKQMLKYDIILYILQGNLLINCYISSLNQLEKRAKSF
jgi:hypothetical protein